jgi:hypothetical protein
MAALFNDSQRQQSVGGTGGLAAIYTPNGGNYYVNVTKDYTWTLNASIRQNAPRVVLREFQVNETTIQRQAQFYTTGANNFLGTSNILSPYEELYQKNLPTGFVYDFPYFSDINFEVNTPMWVSLDNLEQFGKAATGLAGVLGGQKFAGFTESVLQGAGAGAMGALSLTYPKVGITDRPRLWDSHEPRSINIKFPLFNTFNPTDWKKNRELCELLVNQNLYNKRDFITSIPPVFYELLILGQHYSYASCVTQLTIYNRGNMRQLQDDSGIPANVPDVYEVDMTLTDMVMPSKNLFQSIKNKTVVSELVQTSTATTVEGQQQ